MFESQKAEFQDEDQISRTMKEFAGVLEHTLPKMMPHLPSSSVAAKEGL